MHCRHCKNTKLFKILDLGSSPASNAYLTADELLKDEQLILLRVLVCEKCWLVQIEDYALPNQLFNAEYAYLSSTSASWVQHAKDYCEKVIKELNLNNQSMVVEIASNDGYLLTNFQEKKIPNYGIEPTTSTASISKEKGINVIEEFFGSVLAEGLARQKKNADLIIANNVYAHVPDINDFTLGLSKLLKPNGVVTLEFPHVLNLLKFNQFDTIYHEHYSYLSLYTVIKIFESNGLRVWNVEEIETHGGSLRVYGCMESASWNKLPMVEEVLEKETQFGLRRVETYCNLQNQADKIKQEVVYFLNEQFARGKKVIAFGAAAKGNTLLNFSNINSGLVEYVCDNATLKQGKYLPGSRIPIVSPFKLKNDHPDYILIFAWNIKDEIKENIRSLTDNKKFKYVSFIPNKVIDD
jgi:SAM-dependent methyltransferase